MWPECLAEGTLSHRRTEPVEHGFSYPLAMLLVPVDAMAHRADRRRASPVWLRALLAPLVYRSSSAVLRGWPGRTLQARVQAALEAHGLDPASGPCLVLFQPASLGVGFNPVRFVFCLAGDGRRICHVLAEINNTPWNERHTYVLSVEEPATEVRFDFDKDFHVSPFNGMSQRYQWSFRLDRKTLGVDMRVVEGERLVFSAAMSLRLAPLDAAGLLRLALVYPLQPLRTLARIYAQALRLKLRGARFHSHPRYASTTVERPGGSS